MTCTRFLTGRRLLPCLVFFSYACGDGTGPGGGDPTGNRIAFLSSGNVWSMREDGSNQVMLTRNQIGPNDGAHGPLSWSPDGTHLLAHLYNYENALTLEEAAIIAADGSGYRTAASDNKPGFSVGTWSPDGSWITLTKALGAHISSTGIFTARAFAEGETQLDTDAGPFGGAHDLASAWSPRGDEIAFLTDRPVPPDRPFSWHLFSVLLADTTVVQLTAIPMRGFNWSPDGQRLVTLEDAGEFDGTYHFSNIYLVDRATGAATRISPQDNVDGLAEWSPDGTRLAVTSIRDGNVEVYVMNADGSGVQRLTNNPADDVFGAWSPDGTRIALETNRDGNWEIYSMNVDGTGLVNLTRSPDRENNPAWK